MMILRLIMKTLNPAVTTRKRKWDNLFRHPSKEVQLKVLRWRRNAFRPTEFICPVDGGFLSRSHINHAIEGYMEHLMTQEEITKWRSERSYFVENKYTILDFLLNHHSYDLFMEGIYLLFGD